MALIHHKTNPQAVEFLRFRTVLLRLAAVSLNENLQLLDCSDNGNAVVAVQLLHQLANILGVLNVNGIILRISLERCTGLLVQVLAVNQKDGLVYAGYRQQVLGDCVGSHCLA